MVRGIEALAYPGFMQGMQDCTSLEDLAEYCECPVKRLTVICQENWYCLIRSKRGKAELVDLAKIPGSGSPDYSLILEQLKRLKIRRVYLDARKSTSHPIILKMCELMNWHIVRDEQWWWGMEEMREMVINL